MLLSCARAFRQNLAGVPEYRIAVGTLIDREVALEHPARGTERRDARLDVRPPGVRERLRGRGVGELLEAEAANPHAETAELHVNVLALCECFDRLLPAGEDVLVPVRIDADRPTAMIEHDLRVRKGAREISQLVDLRMIHPGIERIPHAMQHGEAFAEFGIRHHARWRGKGRVAYLRIGIVGDDVTDAAKAPAARTLMRFQHLL